MPVPDADPDAESAESPDPVEDVMVEVLRRSPVPSDDDVDAACREHPAMASELRLRLGFLRRAMEPAPGPDAVPSQLGRYRLRRRLGGGGMGVVWLAEALPEGTAVALKLIRSEHLWLEGVRRRFAREAGAVAALAHPGIVPILEHGEHEGVPFCAMALVQGRSLAEVLTSVRDREPATLPPALLRQAGARDWVLACCRVVLQVAEALDHAHGRGIVHRDVKPSNVMLADDGRALLIDFGLARVDSAESMTRSGMQPGSLAYMSPEQVRGEEIDARTDVYSLGVTLYELLTLRAPFLAGNEEATRRAILGAAAPSAFSLNPGIPGPVAAVLATAMAPETRHRYATMAAFAADLRALTAGERVRARPPGPLLRSRRWARRHPARATALALGVLLVTVLPTALLLHEHSARQAIALEAERARAAEARQARQAQTAQRVVRLLQDLFYEVEPARARGASVTARAILERGGQQIRGELQDEPAVRAELLEALGAAYLNLGLIGDAHAHLTESLQLRTATLAQADAELTRTLTLLADVAEQQGRMADAEALRRRALAALADDKVAARAQLQTELAYPVWRQGRIEEAQRLFDEALPVLTRLLPPGDLALTRAQRGYASFLTAHLDQVRANELLHTILARQAAALPPDHPAYLATLCDLATSETELGRPQAAEALLRPALQQAEKVFDGAHPALALLREQLAEALLHQDRAAEALPAVDQVLTASRTVHQPPHFALARALNLESSVTLETGDLQRAERAAREALAMYEILFPEGHHDFAVVLGNLARIETMLGKLRTGEAYAERAVAMHAAIGQRRQDLVALAKGYLGYAQALQGKYEPALANAAAAGRLAAGAVSPHTLARIECLVAEVQLCANRADDGAASATRALQRWREAGSAGGEAWATFLLGWAEDQQAATIQDKAARQQRLADAEQHLRTSLATQRRLYPSTHPFLALGIGNLGVVLAHQQRLAEATPLLEESLAIRRAAGAADNPLLALPLVNLASLYFLVHRDAEALPLAFECLDVLRPAGVLDSPYATAAVNLLLHRILPRLDDAAVRRQHLERLRDLAAAVLSKDHVLVGQIAAALQPK